MTSLYDGKNKIESSVSLVHSRTVIESGDYVSTGVLSYIEGDIIEIEISEYLRFHLGHAVKLTIYSPVGVQLVQTTIVAKDEGVLIVLNPPSFRQKFVDRRAEPRIDVQHVGWIRPKADQLFSLSNEGDETSAASNIPLEILNISMSGVGFLYKHQTKLAAGMQLGLQLELGTTIACQAEIIRFELWESGLYYGAKFTLFPDEKIGALRAFILKAHVEERLKQKKRQDRMR